MCFHSFFLTNGIHSIPAEQGKKCVPKLCLQVKSSPVAGEKRKAAFPELFAPAASQPKKKKGPPLPKNACVMLNEYKPGRYLF